MSEETSGSQTRPIVDFNNPKAPPTILVVGSVLWRLIAWWQGVDFILSIREEKIAMTLQLLLDWGWLILAVAGIVWALGAHKAQRDTSAVHWGMVTSVGILAFMIGSLITVRAIGATPMVLMGWGGDAASKTCNATIDTSRLVGRKEKDHIILLCGIGDPTQDPLEDERIAVSRPFTVTGQATTIVAPYGAMAPAVSQMPQTAGQGFMLWHAVALVPIDLNVSEIKRVSDVARRGGKVITEPQAGAFGNAMAVVPATPPPPCTPAEPKKT